MIAPADNLGTMPTATKRLPAYGRQLLEARKRGLQPRQQMVYIVFDWNLAKAFPRIIVDHAIDPKNYDFSALVGLDVVIGFEQADADLVVPLARAILKANPRRLQAWPLDPDENGKYSARFFKTADWSAHESI
ncbi:MAG: hypothetical protein K2P57_05330 [Burkholderiales bacterium]|nr:hypothetical protein [Burkholderiales bacterium]